MEVDSAFKLVSEYIENSAKGKFAVSELRDIMENHCLSNAILFRKLTEKYGSDIHISSCRGSEPVVFYKCFSASKLCGDWFRDPKSLDQKHRKIIVNVAAELLRDDVENHHFRTESYLPAAEFLETVETDTPPLLTAFMNKLIMSKYSITDNEKR